MKLQLAENFLSSSAGAGFVQTLAQSPEADLYIKVPAHVSPSGTDMYIREDAFDHLPQSAWSATMSYLEPYQTTGMGLFGIAIGKKAIERKQDRKLERMTTKAELKKGIVEARGKAGTGIGAALAGIAGTVSNIITGGSAEGGAIVTPEGDDGQAATQKWYQNPIVLIGGAGAAILLVFLATKKKTTKRK